MVVPEGLKLVDQLEPVVFSKKIYSGDIYKKVEGELWELLELSEDVTYLGPAYYYCIIPVSGIAGFNPSRKPLFDECNDFRLYHVPSNAGYVDSSPPFLIS